MRNILMTATLALCSCMAMAQGHDWENQYVLSINREPARAAFTPYLTAPGDMTMTLDGQWKFNWTKTPDMQPENFLSDRLQRQRMDNVSRAGRLGDERLRNADLLQLRLRVQD